MADSSAPRRRSAEVLPGARRSVCGMPRSAGRARRGSSIGPAAPGSPRGPARMDAAPGAGRPGPRAPPPPRARRPSLPPGLKAAPGDLPPGLGGRAPCAQPSTVQERTRAFERRRRPLPHDAPERAPPSTLDATDRDADRDEHEQAPGDAGDEAKSVSQQLFSFAAQHVFRQSPSSKVSSVTTQSPHRSLALRRPTGQPPATSLCWQISHACAARTRQAPSSAYMRCVLP